MHGAKFSKKWLLDEQLCVAANQIVVNFLTGPYRDLSFNDLAS
jgi:hypothetical protein